MSAMSKFQKLPVDIMLMVCDNLTKKDRTNLSIIAGIDLDGKYKVNGWSCIRRDCEWFEICGNPDKVVLFGYRFCKAICDECLNFLGDGFCYLSMLTRRRFAVAISLGAYPRVKQIQKMRVALNACCIDDVLMYPIGDPETKNGVAPHTIIDGHLIKPTVMHMRKPRYSYGDFEHYNPIFSFEEMEMFNPPDVFNGDSGMEMTVDEELEYILCDEEANHYAYGYTVFGSQQTIRKLDNERDVLSSGYAAVEEAAIISNFKRNIDLGIPVDEAMRSVVGLDVWTMRRHGMSGVKRFIESRICDISKSYGKKPRRKLNLAQMELMERADKMVLDDVLFDKKVNTPSLKSSISRASLASINNSVLEPLVKDKIQIIHKKRSIDAESLVTMSDLGAVINDIGSRLNKDLDKIVENNKIDSRLDDMLLKAGEVQGIYEDLLSYGQKKKDPLILKKSIEGIHNIYNNLINDEIESLERYGETTKGLVEEYKNNNMFDSVPKIMQDPKILQEINQMIDEFGEENQKTVKIGGIVNIQEDSDDTDLSENDDRMTFLFQQSEMEKRNEEIIVEKVGDLMDKDYVDRSDNKYLKKDQCLSILYRNFGIESYDEYRSLNRTKKEAFRFVYVRIMYIFGYRIEYNEREDPNKKDCYFKIFKKFFDEVIKGRTVLRTNSKDIKKFWKSLFAGGLNKDVYKFPSAPDMYEFVVDDEGTERNFKEKVDEFNRMQDSNRKNKIKSSGITEQIEKITKKIEKANRLDLPGYLKNPAISKLKSDLSRLKINLESCKEVLIQYPRRMVAYRKIVSKEWEEFKRMQNKATRKELISKGWIIPGISLTPDEICTSIIKNLEEGSIFERVKKVRLTLDNRYMIREVDNNDYWEKISVVESIDSMYHINDFLLKTTELFYEICDKEMSNKSHELLKFLTRGEETRILCSIISYYCYGYISKSFLPVRKRHRRSVCMALDGFVR